MATPLWPARCWIDSCTTLTSSGSKARAIDCDKPGKAGCRQAKPTVLNRAPEPEGWVK